MINSAKDVSETTDVRTKTRSFHPYGDRELWVLKNQEWALPLFVDWRLEEIKDGPALHYAMVHPACACYPTQCTAISQVLGIHDIAGRKDRWLIPRQVVESLLHKAPGVSPKYYYKWKDPICYAIPHVTPMTVNSTAEPSRQDNVTEGFLSHISTTYSIPSSMLRIVWHAISTEAPRWLLERRGTIEFGFVKLFAVPLRANWKQIVAFQCKRWNLRRIFGNQPGQLKSALEELGMPAVLCSPKNVAIGGRTKSKYDQFRLDYTLEAIPQKAFTTAIIECEAKRMIAGHNSYVAAFERTIEKHYSNLVEALRSYIRKAALPYARVSDSGELGVLRFVPCTGHHHKVHGVGVRHIPVNIMETASDFSILADESSTLPLHPAPSEMPPVSIVPQTADDLRKRQEAGPVVAEGSDDPGDTGLPVCHVDEIENEGGPMLPEPEVTSRNTCGMDREGDRNNQ